MPPSVKCAVVAWRQTEVLGLAPPALARKLGKLLHPSRHQLLQLEKKKGRNISCLRFGFKIL